MLLIPLYETSNDGATISWELGFTQPSKCLVVKISCSIYSKYAARALSQLWHQLTGTKIFRQRESLEHRNADARTQHNLTGATTRMPKSAVGLYTNILGFRQFWMSTFEIWPHKTRQRDEDGKIKVFSRKKTRYIRTWLLHAQKQLDSILIPSHFVFNNQEYI